MLASKEHYAGQILVADLVGAAIIGAGAAVAAAAPETGTNAMGIAAPGVTVFAFGGPLVHALHGNTENGVKSLLARLLLPTAGAALGGLVGQIATGSDDKSPIHGSSGLYWGGTMGAAAGAVAASVIDIVLWSNKDTVASEKTPEPPPPAALRVAPTVAAMPGGAAAGFGGTF